MAAHKNKSCCECGKKLKKDEVALSMKMLGREIQDFFCIEHLAEVLDCPTDDLEIKIAEFKEQGCGLFL
jgi:hypothetical protein